MKSLILMTMLTFISATKTMACDSKTAMVNDYNLYAEVISIDHMTLEFALKVKDARRSTVKVLGGKNYTLKTLPSCEDSSAQEADLNWLNNSTAEHTTFNYQGHTAAYRICLYPRFRKGDVKSYSVCNYEVGD